MYLNQAYLSDSKQEFKSDAAPLVVSCCGIYRLKKQPELITCRPNGRIDYQLLYICAGKAHFILNGQDTHISAGTLVLYRPHELQHYHYHAEDSPEVAWVHFTGFDVESLLERCGLTLHQQTFSVGIHPEYKRLFLEMIEELRLLRPMREELLAATLKRLLILICRNMREETFQQNEMLQAVRYFSEHYQQSISMNDYAKEHHMSVSKLIRNFKEYTQLTPLQYILAVRMTNAQHLLEQTTYNITEIASIVGYDNPLYFSRQFKKHFNISPTQYRKKSNRKRR